MVIFILIVVIVILLAVIFTGGSGAILPQEVEKEQITTSYVEYVSQGIDSYEYCKEKFLTDEEKQVYDEMLNLIKENKNNKSLKISIDSDKAIQVYDYLMMDHPEIFWTAGPATNKHSISILNMYNNSKIEENCIKLANTFTDAIYTINTLDNDKDKVLYIKEIVENPTKYFIENFSEYQECVSFLGSSKGVMKYLLDRTHIKSSYIVTYTGRREYEYSLDVLLDDEWIKIEDVNVNE